VRLYALLANRQVAVSSFTGIGGRFEDAPDVSNARGCCLSSGFPSSARRARAMSVGCERRTHEFGHPLCLDFVRVETVEDPRAKEFGARTWVAAEVLAAHLHRHWHARYRRGEPTDETRVLELGAGTSLPGLVLHELGARVVLTDTSEEGCVLSNIFQIVSACDEKKILRDGDAKRARDARFRAKPPSLEVRHLHWGRLDAEAVALAKTGFDVVIGADVLYGKSRDFHAVFATARLLLENAPSRNEGVFVTAYQHRASHRSIESSLVTNGLVVRRAFRYPAEGGITVDVVEITLADA
jgi:predicted nicotinamide N-methyase